MSTRFNRLKDFLSQLRHKHEDTRLKSAQEFPNFIKDELLSDISSEEFREFMEEINVLLREMISGADINERRAGVLLMILMMDYDVTKMTTQWSNCLMSQWPASDYDMIILIAHALGKLCISGGGVVLGDFTTQQLNRALEWLNEDKAADESKRSSAVAMFKEIAAFTPTVFYLSIHSFYDVIFRPIRDRKLAVREGAVRALRAALIVTSQRVQKINKIRLDRRPEPGGNIDPDNYFKRCYEKAMLPYPGNDKRLTREDWYHGSLLILIELCRCANKANEKIFTEYEELARICHGDGRMSFCETALSSCGGGGGGTSGVPGLRHNSFTHTKLHESKVAASVINENYHKIYRLLGELFGNKSSLIQITILQLLPRLGALNPTAFKQLFASGGSAGVPVQPDGATHPGTGGGPHRASPSLTPGEAAAPIAVSLHNYIFQILQKKQPPEKCQAILCAGFLAKFACIKSGVYFSECLPYFKVILSDPRKHRAAVVPVLVAIGMFAPQAGATHSSGFESLLESMIHSGLSDALTHTLKVIIAKVPKLKKVVLEHLLRQLSTILMPGQQHPSTSRQQPSLPIKDYHGAGESGDVARICLALKSLSHFEFENQYLLKFIRNCSDQWLWYDSKEVKLEAVITCSKLLESSLKAFIRPSSRAYTPRSSHQTITTVQSVIEKLLQVGLTDPDSAIRLRVFDSIGSESFFPFLSQLENLQSLIMAFSDENIYIRQSVIRVLGNLGNYNSACIIPFLRRIILQLLFEVNCSTLDRNKEHAAVLLRIIIQTAPRLMKPYSESILSSLVPKLTIECQRENLDIFLHVLGAVADQSAVCREEMVSWIKDLLPIIIRMLQEPGNAKRKNELGVEALHQLIASTGYVITPYKEHPHLLMLLLNFLKPEQPIKLRRYVVRLLGQLGALDPYHHKVYTGEIQLAGPATSIFSLAEPIPPDNPLKQSNVYSLSMTRTSS